MTQLKIFLSKNSNLSIKKTIENLAIKGSKYLKAKNGHLLKIVTIKGEKQGYYYSPSEKKIILVPRKAEFYLLEWKKDENDRLFLYLPNLSVGGVIISVPEDEIEFLGYN